MFRLSGGALASEHRPLSFAGGDAAAMPFMGVNMVANDQAPWHGKHAADPPIAMPRCLVEDSVNVPFTKLNDRRQEAQEMLKDEPVKLVTVPSIHRWTEYAKDPLNGRLISDQAQSWHALSGGADVGDVEMSVHPVQLLHSQSDRRPHEDGDGEMMVDVAPVNQTDGHTAGDTLDHSSSNVIRLLGGEESIWDHHVDSEDAQDTGYVRQEKGSSLRVEDKLQVPQTRDDESASVKHAHLLSHEQASVEPVAEGIRDAGPGIIQSGACIANESSTPGFRILSFEDGHIAVPLDIHDVNVVAR